MGPGGASWSCGWALEGAWGLGQLPFRHLAELHLNAFRVRRRNPRTSAQNPGMGWAGQGLGCPHRFWATHGCGVRPLTLCSASTQHT